MKRQFPSLASDLSDNRVATKKNIAIVTSDISGPIRNGGVGTAYAHLARCLNSEGHQVTVIFAGRQLPEETNFDFWQEHYWREGIKLVSLPEPFIWLEGFDPARVSYAAYLFLKELRFDIIHFPDMHGVGFYSLQAKKMGLSFAQTLLCVISHGPTSWHKRGNKELMSNLMDLQYDYLEKKSIEYADVLVSPSQYGIHCLAEAGWAIPKRSYVEQYIFPQVSPKAAQKRQKKEYKEIIFFGRLETRKGIELFCDALELIPSTVLRGKSVVFIGINGIIQYRAAEKYFNQRKMKWKFKHRFMDDLNSEEAIQYLRLSSGLVVLPSISETLGFTAIECIREGIPFIASKIEAYIELIDPENHDAVFFDLNPLALAEKIQEALNNEHGEVHYRVDPAVTKSRWAHWHSSATLTPEPKSSLETPLVTVCITHRNRAHFLETCLSSLETQTYKNFEVIVVDDASDSKTTVLYLKSLEKTFSEKGWKIVCQTHQSGPSAARNKGAQLGNGEYILFMDDDNIAKSDELETFIRVALRTDADILTCCFDRFSTMLSNGLPNSESRWLCVGDDISTGVYYNIFGDMNSLFKRAVYLALGGLTEVEGAAYEDYEIFCRAILKGYKLLSIPEALFFYREHTTSYSKLADPLKTAEMRMKPFNDFFREQKLESFLSFSLAMRFKLFPETQSRAPIFPVNRSDYFSALPELDEAVFMTRSRKDYSKLKVSKGGMLAAHHNHAVIVPTENTWVSIPIPKETSGRVLVELEICAFAKGHWKAKFQNSDGKSINSKLGKIEFGPNRLKLLSLSSSTRSIKLSMSPPKHSFVIKNVKISPLKSE